ncbi:hypothetical protein KJ815_12490 [bacterium]|nr:hypothetical protein [bacterium]
MNSDAMFPWREWIQKRRESNEAFNEFCERNERMIGRRLRRGNYQKVEATIAELRIAYRLLTQDSCNIILQPDRQSSGDLRVEFETGEICLFEIKHFTQTEEARHFELFTDEIEKCAIQIPNKWDVAIDVCVDSQPQRGWNHLTDSLLNSLEEITSIVKKEVSQAMSSCKNETDSIHYISGYMLGIGINKGFYKDGIKGRLRVGVRPIFQRSFEDSIKKMIPKLLKATKQLQEKERRVIVLSTFHSPYSSAILRVLEEEHLTSKNNPIRKAMTGINAIAFCGPDLISGPCNAYVWENPEASYPLSEKTIAQIRKGLLTNFAG